MLECFTIQKFSCLDQLHSYEQAEPKPHHITYSELNIPLKAVVDHCSQRKAITTKLRKDAPIISGLDASYLNKIKILRERERERERVTCKCVPLASDLSCTHSSHFHWALCSNNTYTRVYSGWSPCGITPVSNIKLIVFINL